MNWQRTCRMFRHAFRARRARVREEYGPPHSWMQRKVKLEAELRAAGGDVIFEPFAHDHQILLRVSGKLALVDLKAGEAYLFPEPRINFFVPPEIRPFDLERPDFDYNFNALAELAAKKFLGVA